MQSIVSYEWRLAKLVRVPASGLHAGSAASASKLPGCLIILLHLTHTHIPEHSVLALLPVEGVLLPVGQGTQSGAGMVKLPPLDQVPAAHLCWQAELPKPGRHTGSKKRWDDDV